MPHRTELHPNAPQSDAEASQSVAGAPPEHTQNALETERDEWKNKAYRAAAELENARKRHAQELENAKQYCLQSFARDLLPIADNLTRALQAPEGNEKSLRDGVTMVAAVFQQTLQRHGIQQVSSQPGHPFNPDHHQVMSQNPSDHPKDHIVQELQPGYTLNGRLLRPALISVSSGEKNPENSNS